MANPLSRMRDELGIVGTGMRSRIRAICENLEEVRPEMESDWDLVSFDAGK